MSLINDALKKAQKQRTGDAPPLASLPSVGGETPQRIARRPKPPGFDTMMVRAGIGGAVVLLLAIGGFFLLRDQPAPENVGPPLAGAPSTQPASPSTSSNVGSPLVGGPSPATAPVQQPTTSSQQPAISTPTFTLPSSSSPAGPPLAGAPGGPVSAPAVTSASTQAPSSPLPAPSSAPSRGGPVSAPTVSSASTQAPGSPLPAPSSSPSPGGPVSPPAVSPRAIEFIENLKVAGIRASPTDAKVLMNDRVYRLGSQVSAEFGLKLVEIANNSLTFEDDRGGRYTRTF